MTTGWSRRGFLQTLGTLGAGLPLMRMLRSSVAFGQTSPAPLRFAAFVDPHGTWLDYWRPQGTETQFSITFPNAVLAPFDPIKSKVLILDGLSLMPGDMGHNGYAATLTGADNVGSAYGGAVSNASIDQYLASKLGGATPIRSVQLASGEDNDYKPGISYAVTSGANGHPPLPTLNNPYDVYNYLFASFMPPGPGGPTPAQLLAAQKSQLDYVQSDLGRLNARLGPTEQLKLQQHLQAIRDIENQLGAPPLVTACTKPAALTVACPTSGDLTFATNPAVDGDIRNAMVDMLAQAFACDLTRFATFQLASTDDDRPMPYASLPASALDSGDMHITAHDTPNHPLLTATCHNYYASVVARFAKALDAIPEGNGTVLDHTCILWIGNMHDSWDHTNINVPCMLIGGASGAFRTGRYLTYTPLSTDGNAAGPAPTQAHNHLLISILNAFGLADTSFGSSVYTGALPNLT